MNWFENLASHCVNGTYFRILALLKLSAICKHCGQRGVIGIPNHETRNEKTLSGFGICHYCDYQFYFYQDGTCEQISLDHPDYLTGED